MITNGLGAYKSNVSNFYKDTDKKYLAIISLNFYTDFPNFICLFLANREFFKESLIDKELY